MSDPKTEHEKGLHAAHVRLVLDAKAAINEMGEGFLLDRTDQLDARIDNALFTARVVVARLEGAQHVRQAEVAAIRAREEREGKASKDG